jgi:hypothetical protein
MAAAALSDERRAVALVSRPCVYPMCGAWAVAAAAEREGRGCAVAGCVLARTGPEVVSSDWDGLGGGALTRACGRCDEQTEWLTFIGMAVASALLPLLM